ncbi:DTW domain-containing protein [bacterium]|nr:DTW domain-containing protein [bacterium]
MRKNRSPENKCSVCGFIPRLCICSEIEKVNPKIRIILIQHSLDARKPSNTGNLLKGITDCELIRYGKLEDKPVDMEEIEKLNAFVLYPFQDSILLTKEIWKEDETPTIIIPDGTWKQASRLASRLRGHCRGFLRFPSNFVTNYKLRDSREDFKLCTCESAMNVYGILGDTKSERSVKNAFELFVNKNLKNRGRIQFFQKNGI